MSISTTADNTILTLYPPKVQGQTNSIIGAMAGVPKVAIDLVSDGEGAMVLIDPPLAGTWARLDVVKLWLVGDATLLSTFTIGDPNVTIVMRIPRGRMHPDRVNGLYYTVERNSGNIGTSEPPLTLLYNFIRPGLRDRLTVPGGHSELKLDLSDLIAKGVDKDFVSAQICVNYPYCRAYDTITLKCNGEIQTFPVSKDQAPQPPNPGTEEPTTLCFTITRAFLEKAKRLDNILNFSYTVTDQLLNGPDPDAVWSVVLAVPEDLDGTLLPMPILREKLNDPDDKPETIDLEKLAGGPLLVVVLTGDNRFQAGDSVTAEYTASVNGQPDVVVQANGTVEKDEFGQKANCILRIDNDKVIADSSVTVTYELRRPNGDLVGNSIEAKATVNGTAPVDLLPPTLVAPATSPVDVLVYEDGITVRVEHLAALPGDQAQLIEVEPIAGTPPFPLVLINQNKRANFKLTSAYLVMRRGTTRTFYWELVRDGKPIGKSPGLVLVINAIAENDPRLPMPTIAGVTGEVLETNKLEPDSRILSAKWPLQKAQQPLWISLIGTHQNGSAITKDVRTGEPNQSADGLSELAPVDWLKELKDGTPLRIECAVNLDGIKDKAAAVFFPLRTYKISAFVEVRPDIVGVKDSIRENIPEGGTTVDSAVTLSGTASAGQNIQLHDDALPIGPIIKVEQDQTWSQLIDGLTLKPYRFTAVAKYGSGMISTPPRSFKVIDYVEENFDELPDQILKYSGDRIETPVLIIEQLVNSGHNGTQGRIGAPLSGSPSEFNGKTFISGHMFHNGDAQISIKFRAAYKRMSFWLYTNASSAVGTIAVLNNGVKIGEIKPTVTGGASSYFYERSYPGAFNELRLYTFSGTAFTYQFDHIKLYK